MFIGIRSVKMLCAQRPSAIMIGRRHWRQRVDAELRCQSGSMSRRETIRSIPLSPQHSIRSIHSNRVLRWSVSINQRRSRLQWIWCLLLLIKRDILSWTLTKLIDHVMLTQNQCIGITVMLVITMVIGCGSKEGLKRLRSGIQCRF